MYSNSRGIHYTSPPTAADAETEDADAETSAEAPTADTDPTEADANWTGDVPADD